MTRLSRTPSTGSMGASPRAPSNPARLPVARAGSQRSAQAISTPKGAVLVLGEALFGEPRYHPSSNRRDYPLNLSISISGAARLNHAWPMCFILPICIQWHVCSRVIRLLSTSHSFVSCRLPGRPERSAKEGREVMVRPLPLLIRI